MVAASWPPLLFPSLGNYSAVRAIRALRPLRTASRLPGIRRQVDTIVLSLPRLFDVAMLGGFSSEVWTQPLLLMTWQFAKNSSCLLH